MLQERIAGLTTFIEDKYFPYFNYYLSWGMLIARSLVLVIVIAITLCKAGALVRTRIARAPKAQQRTLTFLAFAALATFFTGILLCLAASWHTQLIALVMLAAFVAMMRSVKQGTPNNVPCCKPGALRCACCRWVPALVIIGYIYALFTGWLFLLP